MQIELFTGHDLAIQGMQTAVDNANRVHPDWSDMAYNYMHAWLQTVPSGYRFMTEDARIRSEILGTIPPPPSKRAWGAIILKAARAGLIRKAGYQQVKNKNAHCANATLWQKN